jgi:hypothetical protein
VTKQVAIESMSREASRWFVEDSDGTTMLMTNHLDDPVLVEWDERDGGWSCSSCGRFDPKRNAPVTCPHVMAAGRRLPVTQALGMVSQVMSKSARRAGSSETVEVTTDAERPKEAGAKKRAQRVADHDATFVAATPVVVRQMTDEDRERLAAARARKARTYETPERPNRSHW